MMCGRMFHVAVNGEFDMIQTCTSVIIGHICVTYHVTLALLECD